MNKTVATVVIPICLGVAAAILNLMAVRSATSTVDLTVVNADVKAGTPLTEDMLGRLTVRADKDVFRSAVRYEDRGVLVGRPVARPLVAQEVVLLADIRLSGTFDVRANLRPGERSLTLTVKTTRIVPGLRVGDEVDVVLSGDPDPPAESGDPPRRPTPAARGGRTLGTVGPFRVVGLGERPEGTSGAYRVEDRQVVIAYGAATPVRDFTAVERAAYRRDGGEQILGVEYAR